MSEPPAIEVDARRLLCPMPILRAEAAMRDLPAGALLTLRATDPGLQRDLPAWCKSQGHTLLELRQEGVELVGVVRKSPD